MVFDLSNLPYWILLGLGIILYLSVIVTGPGDDDADLDTDLDVDLEADFNADVDVDVAGGSGEATLDSSDADFGREGESPVEEGLPFLQMLAWLGFGKAPLIILLATDLSLWGLFGWIINTLIVAGRTGISGFLAEAGVMLLSFVMALLLGSWLARPLEQVFASFGEDTSRDRLIGCIGKVSSAYVPYVDDGKICQIDVLDAARNLVTVNAALPNWAQQQPQAGAQVLIIERLEHIYLVISRGSSDEDRWLRQDDVTR